MVYNQICCMLYVTSYKVQDSMKLGYTKPLYILPFDHRASFLKKMFGIENRQPTDQETKTVADFKAVIYEGFKACTNFFKSIVDELNFGDTYYVIGAGYGTTPGLRPFWKILLKDNSFFQISVSTSPDVQNSLNTRS